MPLCYQFPESRKRSIAVIARQHPGEVVASWCMQGFLRFILGDSPYAKSLRTKYLFHVVPMVNVDGVYVVGISVISSCVGVISAK